MGNEVVKAATKVGVEQSKINNFQAQVNAIDLEPIVNLFDWSSPFFTWTLHGIDWLQSIPLWALTQFDPDNAAKVAALLQRLEDFINAKRGGQPAPPTS